MLLCGALCTVAERYGELYSIMQNNVVLCTVTENYGDL